jgi:hypothetical protein
MLSCIAARVVLFYILSTVSHRLPVSASDCCLLVFCFCCHSRDLHAFFFSRKLRNTLSCVCVFELVRVFVSCLSVDCGRSATAKHRR